MDLVLLVNHGDLTRAQAGQWCRGWHVGDLGCRSRQRSAGLTQEPDSCSGRRSEVPGAVHGLHGHDGRRRLLQTQVAHTHLDTRPGQARQGDQLARYGVARQGCHEPERAGRALVARGDPGDDCLTRSQVP